MVWKSAIDQAKEKEERRNPVTPAIAGVNIFLISTPENGVEVSSLAGVDFRQSNPRERYSR